MYYQTQDPNRLVLISGSTIIDIVVVNISSIDNLHKGGKVIHTTKLESCSDHQIQLYKDSCKEITEAEANAWTIRNTFFKSINIQF